jgi:hypothetical protein
MLQLVFLSSRTGPLTDVEAIREQSSANNRRDAITGCLIERNGYYFQALEGPKELVENAFLRMIVDDRHREVYLLSRALITRRQFGEWPMAVIFDEAEKERLIAIAQTLAADLPPEMKARFVAAFGGLD